MFAIIVYSSIFILFAIILCVNSYQIILMKKEIKRKIRQMSILNEEINEQYEDIQHRDQIIESRNMNIERKEKMIGRQSNDIQELWRSSLLQKILNKQMNIYSEKKLDF